MAKKLTLSNVEQELNIRKETFTLTINDEWDIEIHSTFSKEGIANAVNNMSQVTFQIGKWATEEVLAPYFYISLIKEFTDLGDDIPDDIQSQAEVIKKLVEMDLFLPIIEAFPEKEVKKVMNHMKETVDSINETMDSFEEKTKEHEFLENKELENLLRM